MDVVSTTKEDGFQEKPDGPDWQTKLEDDVLPDLCDSDLVFLLVKRDVVSMLILIAHHPRLLFRIRV
jgi:hypothetical protein